MKRLDALLLAGVGVLTVHQLSYTASSALGYESSIAHGHLATAWLIGSLAALAGLAGAISHSLRRRGHQPDSYTTLVAAIGAIYIGMEALERTWDGAGAASLIGEPVFWLGLMLTPIVAFGLRWSVRRTQDLVAFVLGSDTARGWPASTATDFGSTSVLVPAIALRSAPTRRRGPPAD